MSKRIEVNDLNVYYGKFLAVEGVSLTIEPRTVTAFIGVGRRRAIKGANGHAVDTINAAPQAKRTGRPVTTSTRSAANAATVQSIPIASA